MPSMLTRRLLAATLLLGAACAPQVAPAPGAPTVAGAPAAVRPAGTLLIVGGGPQPDELVRRFVELAGGPGRARIVVFPQASSVAETGPEKVAQLEAFGASAVNLPLTRDQASREASARLLDSATGVWFAGGDQARITAALGGTPVARALLERYRAGAVIAGTSAGAAVMSERMITGNEQRPGGARPSEEAWITIERDNVEVVPGLGLLPGAIVDQHFVRRKRHNRLLSLVLEHPERLGVGIDESTAIEVGPDGRWTVRGASVAVIYDARQAQVGAVGTGPGLAAAGMRLHVLPAGATFDPATGEARLP